MKNPKLLFVFILLFSVFLQQCCTTQEGVKNGNDMKKMNNVIETVPRGMALLSMKILEVDESKNRMYCTATVETVHGYGNDVRPIAKNTDYKFEVDDKLKDKIKSFTGERIKCKVIQQRGGIN